MLQNLKLWVGMLKEEKGAHIVEYALIIVLVAIAVALASPSITSAVLGVFSDISSLLGVR